MFLEVPDFYGGGDTNVFMDWLHNTESFFDFHSISDGKRLKFAETKLKGTTKIWWNNHKEEHKTLDTFRHRDDLRAAMRRRFEVPRARQRALLQLMQIQQGSSIVEEYTNRFHHLAACTQAHWDNDLMIALYRHGLRPQIAANLCSTHLSTLPNAIHIAYATEDHLKGT